MMRDSSSVRLIWSVAWTPGAGGLGGLPPGFLSLSPLLQSWVSSRYLPARKVLTSVGNVEVEVRKVAVGDGALGFWAALDEVFPETRGQRYWVHKTANVLSVLPKSLQGKAKAGLHEIWMAPNRAQAVTAFDQFLKTYRAKYPKAVDKLIQDRDALLAFYDFSAEHWLPLRTTNRSNRRLPPCVTALRARRTASHIAPSWTWPSSSSRKPRMPRPQFSWTRNWGK